MKTKTKKTKKRAGIKRRVHSSLDSLPLWLCETLTGMVEKNKWPDDFGDHYNGTPRHIDMVKYCKAKGYNISMSAMGRYAKRVQALQNKKIQAAKLLGSYVNLYLSTIGKRIQEAGNEILELEMQTILDDYSKNRITELQDTLKGLNRYYVKIVTVLKEAET